MTQNYPRQRNSEDAIGILLLVLGGTVAFVWFIAVSRLHMRNQQCLELFLYIVIGLFGAGMVLGHFVGRKRHAGRELATSATRDQQPAR